MFSFLYKFLKGSITLEAKGFAVERFINLVVHSGIKLREIQRTGNCILFESDIKYFRKLLKFSKKAGIHLKIMHRHGCPFFVYKYRKRYVFTTGIIVFSLFLFLMSSFVWLIEIKGNADISKYEIMTVLSENGLKTGCIKYFVNTPEIEQALKKNIKKISWIHIKISGTRAVVEISEDIPNPQINSLSSPCDIISGSDALVTEIITTSGKPMVKAGDTVKKGSVLISADITYLQDGAEVVYGQVSSSGTIKGKVLRNFKASLPYQLKLRRYTGNRLNSFSLKIFNANFNTNFIKRDVSFEKYDIIKEIKQLRLGERFPLPIYIEKLSWREYNEENLSLSPKEAQKLCSEKLDKEIMEFYSTENDILDKNCTFEENKDGVTAFAAVTAVENIGKVSYIIPEDTKGGNKINGTGKNTDSE